MAAVAPPEVMTRDRMAMVVGQVMVMVMVMMAVGQVKMVVTGDDGCDR